MKAYILILLSVFAVSIAAKSLYNHHKSYVTPLTSLNFEQQIPKIRQTTKYVSLVHYYKYSDGASKEFAKAYDEFTNEFRGVFKILACDCDESPQVCEKEKIPKYPTVRVYPPNPVPALDYEGDLDPKKIMNFASKYLQSNVISITTANIDTFINENPSVPKVFLFTDKKGIPTIYKSLSISFDKKLLFGIIRSDDQDLIDRYNINKFPKIIVVKVSEKKPKVYNGEIRFQAIFDFLNVFSETFVPGGGSSQDSAATKAWLTEIVPEMNFKSANDICVKVEGALCVIFLDKGKPEKTHIDLMKELHKIYEKKISRGSTFKFMWLNVEREKAWAGLFSAPNTPGVAVLNPGKRKRFVLHEGELSLNSLKSTLEKINGGDAKFNPIKTPELPLFEIIPETK